MNKTIIVLALMVGATGCSDDACDLTLGTSPSGCPDAATAEAAFADVESACGISASDIDTTNANSPTLTSTAADGVCESCACQEAIAAYRTHYASCTDSDQSNAAFSKNLYDIADGC